MLHNPNAIWIKRAIAGVDQSYLFLCDNLHARIYNAIPDPTQVATKNFLTGIACVLTYELNNNILQVKATIINSDDTAFDPDNFVVIKEGTNNAQESNYISVVKLHDGDVIGVSPTAVDPTGLAAGDTVVIDSDGKWVEATGSHSVGTYLGKDINGLYIFKIKFVQGEGS